MNVVADASQLPYVVFMEAKINFQPSSFRHNARDLGHRALLPAAEDEALLWK